MNCGVYNETRSQEWHEIPKMSLIKVDLINPD